MCPGVRATAACASGGLTPPGHLQAGRPGGAGAARDRHVVEGRWPTIVPEPRRPSADVGQDWASVGRLRSASGPDWPEVDMYIPKSTKLGEVRPTSAALDKFGTGLANFGLNSTNIGQKLADVTWSKNQDDLGRMAAKFGRNGGNPGRFGPEFGQSWPNSSKSWAGIRSNLAGIDRMWADSGKRRADFDKAWSKSDRLRPKLFQFDRRSPELRRSSPGIGQCVANIGRT